MDSMDNLKGNLAMNFTNTDCVACLDDWDISEEFRESEAANICMTVNDFNEVFWQVFHVTYQNKYKITKINTI